MATVETSHSKIKEEPSLVISPELMPSGVGKLRDPGFSRASIRDVLGQWDEFPG